MSQLDVYISSLIYFMFFGDFSPLAIVPENYLASRLNSQGSVEQLLDY
jgi:hypothetical protein